MLWSLTNVFQRFIWKMIPRLWCYLQVLEPLRDGGLFRGSALERAIGTLTSSFIFLLPAHHELSSFLFHNEPSNNGLKSLRAKIIFCEPKETVHS